MKYSILKEIEKYLQKFKTISSIGRVNDTVIKVVFGRDEVLFFDMKKGDSYIFKKDEYRRAKIYNAPFDVVLYKRLGRSKIQRVSLLEGNRVLRLHVESNSSYKSQKSILQLEFTGRNTNAIILDEDEVVLEALRHIDSSVSYRSVKVGEKLNELPPFEIREKKIKIDDIQNYLYEEYEKRAKNRIEQIKSQKITLLQKKIKKLQKLLEGLQNEKELLKKSETYALWGTLIFSNIDKIRGYEKEIELMDFDSNPIKITLPKEARSGVEAGNILFEASKKLKRKAKSLYIERENLSQKRDFFQKLQNAIKQAGDETEINILYPKQKHQKKAQGKQVSYESFYIEGFKVMLGKNEKGNIELLKEAKKRDIWLHLKDIPSSHVIIRTDKQNIPQSVLEFASKLCTRFSVTQKGSYLVDYTSRRDVKVVEGAHVNYVNYKTISVST